MVRNFLVCMSVPVCVDLCVSIVVCMGVFIHMLARPGPQMSFLTYMQFLERHSLSDTWTAAVLSGLSPSPHSSSCFNLPETQISSVGYHVSVFNLGSRDWTQVSVLATKNHEWLAIPPNLTIITLTQIF